MSITELGGAGLLKSAIVAVWAVLISASSGSDLGDAAAIVNGATITTGEVERVVESQVAELRRQEVTLRRTALNKLIDNRLIEQAAATRGIAVADLLRREVESATVSDKDVDEAWERSKRNYPGVLPSEVKYRIRRTLEDNRRAAALQAFMSEVRKTAIVRNLLIEGVAVRVNALATDGPSRGEQKAPVTVLAFLDFQCPYCRDFAAQMEKILKANGDRVRFVVRQFPLSTHVNAFDAARAAACADRQQHFWDFYERAFSGRYSLDAGGLMQIAGDIRLDTAGFSACLASGDTAEQVRRDIAAGSAIGVAGTPALFVNGNQLGKPSELTSVVSELLANTPRPESSRSAPPNR